MAIDGDRTVEYVVDNLKKNKLAATVDPTVNDDANDGYSVGSVWINTSTSNVWKCTDATVGAAVWSQLTGGGSLPTPTGWGANTETLSADKTLTDSDDIIQFLNPNGGDYDVNLPAEGVNNKAFAVVNTGVTGTLTFRTSGGVYVNVADAGQMFRLWSDGNAWYGAALDAGTAQVYGTLQYASDTLFDDFTRPASDPTDGGDTSIQYYSRAEMADTGTIRLLAINSANSGAFDFDIYKNGALADSATQTTQSPDVVSVDVPFAPGDDIAIKGLDDSGRTNIGVIFTTDGGSSIAFGGLNVSAGLWYAAGGNLLADPLTIISRGAQIAVPALDTKHLSYYSGGGGDATTTWKLWKNGASSETVNHSGTTPSDSVALSTSFASGDLMALEFDAGTYVNQWNFWIWTDFNGGIATFGTRMSSSSYYAVWSGDGGYSYNYSTLDATTEMTFPWTVGTVQFSWRTDNTLGANGHRIYKNGALAETVASNGTSDGIATLSTTFAEDDQLAIGAPTTSGYGDYSVFGIFYER
jgi:hypothetical protein